MLRPVLLFVTFLVCGSAIPPAHGQSSAPSLEQIEAQIKARQAEQAAAAKREREREAERVAEAQRQADSERAAQLLREEAASLEAAAAARRASLRVESELECELKLGEKGFGTLAAGVAQTIALEAGDWSLRCDSTADRSQFSAQTVHLDPGQSETLRLDWTSLDVPADFASPGSAFRDRLKDRSAGPEMRVIAGGSFQMGAATSEAGFVANEAPVHPVELSAFALSQGEITVAQFRQFATAAGYRSDAEQDAGGHSGCFAYRGGIALNWTAGSSWQKPGFPQDDRHPAVCLSWNDASAYVTWLSAQTGQKYRLPSEAELEYVIRAGSTGRYAWGEEPAGACIQANGFDQTALKKLPGIPAVQCDDGFVFTSPSASLQPNAFGLSDMVGNALEWAADCWNKGYAGAPADGRAWLTGDCNRRVLRGAGWNLEPALLRSAARSLSPADGRSSYTGFRVARDP